MDTTVRNLDERVYRDLKAWAAREEKTVGQAVNEAMRAYLAGPGARRGTRSLEELRPEPFPRATSGPAKRSAPSFMGSEWIFSVRAC